MHINSIKSYIRLFVILLVSIMSISLYAFISSLSINDFIKNISLAVFSTGVVLFFYELIYINRGEKYFEEIINKTIPVYSKMKSNGLEDISNTFELDKYKEEVIHSKKMTIVMNDGKSFIGRNSDFFKQRFGFKGKETNFVLLNPKSEFIEILNKKNGKDSGYYQIKILDVIKEILHHPHIVKGHTVNIYVHDMYNTMSVIQLDNIAMISLYRLSGGKDTVPHLVFRNTGTISEFNRIADDTERLIVASKKIDEQVYSDLVSKK